MNLLDNNVFLSDVRLSKFEMRATVASLPTNPAIKKE
jgi:hypothetical protein